MSNEVTIVVKEMDLIKSIQYYRLKREKELLERDKTTAENNIKDGTKWYNIITNSKNAINNKKSEKKSNQLETVDSFISKFEKENSNYHYNLWFDGTLSNYLDDLYSDDKYGLQKLMLGVSLVLDDSFDYKYEDEQYQEISKALFGNLTKMNEIKKVLKENYVSIASKNLSNLQKGVLIGLGVGGLVLACTLPVMIVGGAAVSAATTTAAPAAAAPTGEGLEVLAPLEGKAYMVSNSSETPKKVGDHVEEGDIICYIEAMKVFNRIKAEKAGTITSINFTSGDSVEEDDVLMTIA